MSDGKTSGNNRVADILLIVLGIIAIVLPFVAGLSIAIFVGTVMMIGGFFLVVSSFAAKGTTRFVWHLSIGFIYALGGLLLTTTPAFDLLTFTLILALIFFTEGVVEVLSFLPLRKLPGLGLVLLNGMITLLLGVMIWRGWPWSSGWALGTLIGVNLVTTGFSRLNYRRVNEATAQLA